MNFLPAIAILISILCSTSANRFISNNNVNNVTNSATTCSMIDIIAIVDSSTAQGCYNFYKMRDFLSTKLIPTLSTSISPTGDRIGAVSYTSYVTNDLPIDKTTTSTALRAQLGMWTCQEGKANPNSAFLNADTSLLLNRRPNVPNVVIWLSNGRVNSQNGDPAHTAQAMKQQFGTQFICVGVPDKDGGLNSALLNQICGPSNTINSTASTLTMTSKVLHFVTSRIKCGTTDTTTSTTMAASSTTATETIRTTTTSASGSTTTTISTTTTTSFTNTTTTSTSTTTAAGSTTTTSPSTCTRLDIIAVADQSSTQPCSPNFINMKTLFSEGLVQKFANSIGPRGIRFGGISYSGQVNTANTIQLGAFNAVGSLNLAFFDWICRSSGVVNPDSAFKVAAEMLSHRHTLFPSRSVFVWLTNGLIGEGMTDPMSTAMKMKKLYGTRFICVGVPGTMGALNKNNTELLERICGTENMMVLQSASQLNSASVLDFIVQRFPCGEFQRKLYDISGNTTTSVITDGTTPTTVGNTTTLSTTTQMTTTTTQQTEATTDKLSTTEAATTSTASPRTTSSLSNSTRFIPCKKLCGFGCCD